MEVKCLLSGNKMATNKTKNVKGKMNKPIDMRTFALMIAAAVVACCLITSTMGSSIKRRRAGALMRQGMGRSRYRFPGHYDVLKKGIRYMDPLMRATDLGPEDIAKGLDDERELQEFLKEMEENDRQHDEEDDSRSDDDDDSSNSSSDEENKEDENNSDKDDSSSEEDEDEDQKRKKRPWMAQGSQLVMEPRMPYIALPEYSSDAIGPLAIPHPPTAAVIYGRPAFMRSGFMDRRRRMLAGKKRAFTVSDVYATWHKLPASVKYEPYKYHHGLLGEEEREREGRRNKMRPSEESEEDDEEPADAEEEDERDDLKKRYILGKRRFALPIFLRRQPDSSEELMYQHDRRHSSDEDDKKKRLAMKRKFAALPSRRAYHNDDDNEDEEEEDERKRQEPIEMTKTLRDRREPPPLPMGGNKLSDYFGFDKKRKKREAADIIPSDASTTNQTDSSAVQSTQTPKSDSSEEYYSDSKEDNKEKTDGRSSEEGDLVKRKKRSRQGAIMAAHRRQELLNDWLRRRSFAHLADTAGRHDGEEDDDDSDEDKRKKRMLMIKRRFPAHWMINNGVPEEERRLRWRNGRDQRAILLKKRFGRMFSFGNEQEDSEEDDSCAESNEDNDDDGERKKRTCLRKKVFQPDEVDDDSDSQENYDEEKKTHATRRQKWQDDDSDEDRSNESDDSDEEDDDDDKKKKRMAMKRRKKSYGDQESGEDSVEDLDEELSHLANDIMGEIHDMDRSREVYPASELEDRLESVHLIRKIKDTLRERGEAEESDSDEEDEDDQDKKKKRALVGRNLPHLFPPTTPRFQKKNQGGDQECPALENILEGCVRASTMAGDHELRFVDACNLLELCGLCGEGFRLVSSDDCEAIFLDKMEEVCPSGEPGCLEKSYKMAVAVDRLNPGGEEDPNQCYQESCVTSYLKREFGDLIPLKK